MTSTVEPASSLLASLVPLGAFIAVSLIIPHRAGFLLGGRPVRLTSAGPVVELTGIGGGLQPSDHSLTDAARREAREEVYSDVRLLPCKGTLWVRGPDQVEKIACAGGERPAAIVFRHHRTPPHQPWHAQHRGETCLVVFLDELLSCPHPTPEVPLLTWLDPETLCAIARTDLPFEALPGRFALLSPRACPPEGTLVRLTDSQESLVLALGIEAEPFYRGIAERYS